MRRIPVLLLVLLACAALPAGAREAAADERVPDVARGELPVAGTCAPLGSGPSTLVQVGVLGAYRVDGRPEVIDEPALVALLKQRAAATPGGPGRHAVWVVTSAANPFLPVARVHIACQQAGIFRVGLQVQSEQGSAVMGFPIFLPATAAEPAASGAPAQARRLAVRLDRTEGPEESNPRRLWLAAQQAVERFGPVVAEVSLDANLATQHVLTCLDMLYRGGVSAVKLGFRAPTLGRRTMEGGVERTRVPRLLLVQVQGRPLPVGEPAAALPPIAPRKAPWGDEGASQPGALGLVLEDIDEGKARAAGSAPAAAAEVLPSYAGRHEGAPEAAVAQADRALATWAQAVGKSLLEALKGVATLPAYMVKRQRDVRALAEQVTPLQQLFPDAQRVQPSTLQMDVFLVRENAVVGKVASTLYTGGGALSFIFARWVVEPFPQDLVLPPLPTDPFAAGVPGHLRVWLEASLAAVYRQGAGGLRLAPEREVLGYLPAVAQAGARAALASRLPEMEQLAAELQRVPYDRLLLVPRQATAAVVGGGAVRGIVQYGLEAEERELRLVGLSGRAAPR
ncbi:MAG: ExbD/TolR family protein [Planctomycetia bacterium]